MAATPPAAGPPPAERIGDLLQSYLDDAAVFLSALEELQGQLSTVERHRDALQPKEADVLKRVLEKAPSAGFRRYLSGEPAPGPGRPRLAQQIDDNVRLLGVLGSAMRGYVAGVAALQERLQREMAAALGAVSEEGGGGGGQEALPAVDANVAAAALVDGLRQDLELTARVAAAVSLLTPAEQVGSYATLLRIQPFLRRETLAEALSWRR